jgi:molybdopterin synthase sulfur carrier subunit
MSVNVRFPSQLRCFVADAAEVSSTGTTVGEILDDLARQFPTIKEHLCDPDGQVRRFVNVYVNGEDIRFVANLETGVEDGDEIVIIPAIAGG